MIDAFARVFPRFASLAADRDLEEVLPPASPAEIASLEKELRLALPESYKALLACARGFWLMGGVVQFGSQHPFVHNFPPMDSLNAQQRQTIARKGGPWPPASQGMLCFAEFFMEADGDQVLFDTSRGLVDNEYPIMYWAHEDRPPSVRRLADSFTEFMEEFLMYPEFAEDDDG
jgi:SMI1 / KNR4 family (SUKH-1)